MAAGLAVSLSSFARLSCPTPEHQTATYANDLSAATRSSPVKKEEAAASMKEEVSKYC